MIEFNILSIIENKKINLYWENMKKEVKEKFDLCEEIVYCVYFEDWGVWICNNCYWGKISKNKEYNKIIL